MSSVNAGAVTLTRTESTTLRKVRATTYVDLFEQRALTRPVSFTLATLVSRDVQPTRTPATSTFVAFLPAIVSCC